MRIKLFADGANITEMYQLYVDGKVQGFTTNPTLLKKAGVTNYELFAKKVLELIPDMPISFEVFSDEMWSMEREARIISSWGDNVYVKIPVTNTKGMSSADLIYRLSHDGIKVNVTAILTTEQVREISKVLIWNTPSIVSVFAGRIADTGRDPVTTMQKSHEILRLNSNTELLWASPRSVLDIMKADMCCCDIITLTTDVTKKLHLIGKDLKEFSLETVQMFYNDAKEAGYKI